MVSSAALNPVASKWRLEERTSQAAQTHFVWVRASQVIWSKKIWSKKPPKYCWKKSIQVVISFAVVFGLLVFCKCTTIISMQILFVPNLSAGYLSFFLKSPNYPPPPQKNKWQALKVLAKILSWYLVRVMITFWRHAHKHTGALYQLLCSREQPVAITTLFQFSKQRPLAKTGVPSLNVFALSHKK